MKNYFKAFVEWMLSDTTIIVTTKSAEKKKTPSWVDAEGRALLESKDTNRLRAEKIVYLINIRDDVGAYILSVMDVLDSYSRIDAIGTQKSPQLLTEAV